MARVEVVRTYRCELSRAELLLLQAAARAVVDGESVPDADPDVLHPLVAVLGAAVAA